jgi:replicative DNA helicase
MTVYLFERQFRLKILALLLDDAWLSQYGKALVRPEYFELEDEIAVAKAIITYIETYDHAPQDPEDIIALSSAKYSDIIYKIYDLYEEHDLELASTRTIEFARQQAMKLAILESVDDIESMKYDKIQDRIAEALRVGEDLKSVGLDPVKDVSEWLYDYWSDKVRTGMYHLDKILDGGLGVPELGIIMAPPNQGKSMALVNIGYGAASIGSAKNVVHFTHEMKVSQVAKRYAARFMFRFPKLEDGDLAKYEAEFLESARRFVPGKIRIIGGSKMTFDAVESHLSRLADSGYNIGLIIDDYPDLMIPRRRYSERRFELSSIYEDWRSISEKYNVPVWGATQAGRAALSKEIITMADISEDIGKAAIADVIVAVCQTYDERQMETARLYIAKLRDGKNTNQLISCRWITDSQAIITTGLVNPKEKQRDA